MLSTRKYSPILPHLAIPPLAVKMGSEKDKTPQSYRRERLMSMTSGLRPEACKGSLLQAGLTRLPLGASCAEKASVVAGVEERNDITER